MVFLLRATFECEIEAASVEAAYDLIYNMTDEDMLAGSGAHLYGEHVANPDTGEELPDPNRGVR